MSVCCVSSPPRNPASRCTGDFWSRDSWSPVCRVFLRVQLVFYSMFCPAVQVAFIHSDKVDKTSLAHKFQPQIRAYFQSTWRVGTVGQQAQIKDFHTKKTYIFQIKKKYIFNVMSKNAFCMLQDGLQIDLKNYLKKM